MDTREYGEVRLLEAAWKYPVMTRWRRPYGDSMNPSERGRSGLAAWYAWTGDRIDLGIAVASLTRLVTGALILWKARRPAKRARPSHP